MNHHKHTYINAYQGSLFNMLHWPQLDVLWKSIIRQQHKSGYLYAPGEVPPNSCISHNQLTLFIEEIDKLLRAEHQQDYCGILDVDDQTDPSFIKIYDPNNLGMYAV